MPHDDKLAKAASGDDVAVAHLPHGPDHHALGDDEAGEVVHLERRFSFLACLGMAFIMLNSWTGMSASLGVVLPSGGSVSVVYGCLVSAVGAATTGLSLAEFCHVYPLTGGQYDWVYIIAPQRHRVALSYTVGWLSAAGWIALTAVSAAFCGTFVTAFVAVWHPEFSETNWQTFLVYIAFCIIPFLLNTFAIRLLPLIEKAGFYWGVSGIVVVSITLLATASPSFRSGKEVFATFTNQTGWPDGVAFLLGLLQSTLGLAGYDAITHMMEEMPAPSKNGPRVLLWAIGLGTLTGWLFLVILLVCAQDLDAVIASPSGPLLAIYQQATKSAAGATCLAMFNFMCMVFMTQGIMTIASRMVWTFARDRGLGHLSRFLAPVHPTLKVPVWSVAFVLLWCVILGLIYLGSTVAFNAIASSSLSLLQISYFIPILIVFIRGDAVYADQPRTWSLGVWRRPINAVALAFLLTTSVFFAFPPALPVSGSSMNYDAVVIAIVALLAGGTWVTDSRHNFLGPSELEARVQEGRRTW